MAIVEVPGVALASAIAAKAAGLAQNTITIVASSCAVRTWIESFETPTPVKACSTASRYGALSPTN